MVYYCIIQVPDIHVYNVDISDWDKTRHAVQQIGPVDLLVNNAGINVIKPFLEVDKQELNRYENMINLLIIIFQSHNIPKYKYKFHFRPLL